MKKSRIVYYDSYSIAVINPKGKIRQLYCPFLVKCIESSNEIKVETLVYVEEVIVGQYGYFFYKIGGQVHPYSNFTININF